MKEHAARQRNAGIKPAATTSPEFFAVGKQTSPRMPPSSSAPPSWPLRAARGRRRGSPPSDFGLHVFESGRVFQRLFRRQIVNRPLDRRNQYVRIRVNSNEQSGIAAFLLEGLVN